MRVALAQINPTIGDFPQNTKLMLDYIQKAKDRKAELVVFPEMSLCGYPPMDLLDFDAFWENNLKHLRLLQQSMPQDIGAVIGYVDKNRQNSGKRLLNTTSLLYNSKVLFSQAKTLLPTYDVFDEARYFEPASRREVCSFRGLNLGIAICEDIWWEQDVTPGTRYPVDPVRDLLDQGAALLLAPSASPYYLGKPQIRLNLINIIGKSSGIPVIYVNMVGGNDNLIFDGQSMYTDAAGNLKALAAAFREDLIIVDTAASTQPTVSPNFKERKYEDLKQALCLGLADYVHKCGFHRVHLGLSGGIDSAVAACLAVSALGSANVTAFALPSEYSSPQSFSDAKKLADNLKIPLHNLSIGESFDTLRKSLAGVFAGKPPDITEENLQARIRGTMLMAYANKFNSLLLATGNKSELATGYCTLYGDMNGSLAVIGDLLKTEVYALAHWFNREHEIIPANILTKAPTAELRPNQKDSDSLPPYEQLDHILQLYVIENKSLAEIVSLGYELTLVKQVLKMVGTAEYKRRQAPPVLKVTERAFGTGRRMPIARNIFEATSG